MSTGNNEIHFSLSQEPELHFSVMQGGGGSSNCSVSTFPTNAREHDVAFLESECVVNPKIVICEAISEESMANYRPVKKFALNGTVNEAIPNITGQQGYEIVTYTGTGIAALYAANEDIDKPSFQLYLLNGASIVKILFYVDDNTSIFGDVFSKGWYEFANDEIVPISEEHLPIFNRCYLLDAYEASPNDFNEISSEAETFLAKMINATVSNGVYSFINNRWKCLDWDSAFASLIDWGDVEIDG